MFLTDSEPMILISATSTKQYDFYDEAIDDLGEFAFVENPKDLISQAIAQRASLIVIDVELIGDEADRVCQQLRENTRTKNIPFLLVNVANESAKKVRGLQTGAQDVITKPFSSLELHRRIERQLENLDIKEQWQTQNNYLKRTVSRQKSLSYIIRRIRNSLDLDDIFQSTAKEIYQALSCSRVVIYRFNEDWSGNFAAEAFSPQWRSLVDVSKEVDKNFAKNSATNQDSCVVKVLTETNVESLKDTYLQENQGGIFTKGMTYRAVDDIGEARLTPCYLRLLESFAAKAYVIIPIFFGDRLWGLLGVYQNDKPRHWRSEEIEMLIQISAQLSVALQQTELLTQLRTAKEKAESANQAKGLFLASMNHELRTPLSAILGFTELLANDENLTADQIDSLDSIYTSGEHLLSLINDVLSVSQIEAGKVNLCYKVFDLFHCINAIKDIVSLSAREKQINLYCELNENLPEHICLDEGKLKQILINLLNNAIKFTSSGQVTLRINPVQTETESGIKFEVIDTGEGMDEEELQLLFQSFQQTSTGLRSKQGTGLGLAISQKLVQMMGGEIKVSSRPGEGSHFWFTLLIDLGDTRPIVAPSSIANVDFPLQKIPQLAAIKVLVVEDHKEQRDLLSAQLMSLGFTTKAVVTGEEGIQTWYEWQPDLLLLDLRMPSVDGDEVIQEIRQAIAANSQYKTPKIIMITADVFYSQTNPDLELDCDDILYKPIQLEQLLHSIAQLLQLDY